MKKRNWVLVADLILTFILDRRKLKAQEKLKEKQSAAKDATWKMED